MKRRGGDEEGGGGGEVAGLVEFDEGRVVCGLCGVLCCARALSAAARECEVRGGAMFKRERGERRLRRGDADRARDRIIQLALALDLASTALVPRSSARSIASSTSSSCARRRQLAPQPPRLHRALTRLDRFFLELSRARPTPSSSALALFAMTRRSRTSALGGAGPFSPGRSAQELAFVLPRSSPALALQLPHQLFFPARCSRARTASSCSRPCARRRSSARTRRVEALEKVVTA